MSRRAERTPYYTGIESPSLGDYEYVWHGIRTREMRKSKVAQKSVIRGIKHIFKSLAFLVLVLIKLVLKGTCGKVRHVPVKNGVCQLSIKLISPNAIVWDMFV